LQFKLRAAEERQENDLALIKDKQIDKSERKAAKQRVKDRMNLVPQLNDEQNTLEIKLEKIRKNLKKLLIKLTMNLINTKNKWIKNKNGWTKYKKKIKKTGKIFKKTKKKNITP